MDRAKSGILYATAAYLVWGLSPLYWKLLDRIPARELVAHRILWCALLLVALLAARRQLGAVAAVVRSRRVSATLLVTTGLIATNWFLYIWAVNSSHIVEASLGYFVTPLVTVLLGLVFLGERLSRGRGISLVLAAVGVTVLAARLGHVPWISLVLAFTFAFYGLLRKTVRAEPEVGLLVETSLLAPWMLGYLLVVWRSGEGAFGRGDPGTDLLLATSGLVTALPLVWFTHGARRLPLATLGFLQYLAPTLQFLLGVLVYREPFSSSHLLAFLFIWSALVLFSLDSHERWRRRTSAAD